MEDINKTIKIKDQNPIIWVNKIFILIDAGRLGNAKNTLRIAQSRFPGNKKILGAESALDFAENTQQQQKMLGSVEEKLEDVKKEIPPTNEQLKKLKGELNKVKNQIEEDKIKIVEFLGIFAGIIAFIVSGITIMKDYSLFGSLVLMLGLALSLITFVLTIDIISLSRFYNNNQKTNPTTKIKLVALGLVFVMLLLLLALAFFIEPQEYFIDNISNLF
ncbi:MAG: hypothetical protein KAT28_01205 [Candidatus Aenigmarchaeota archaeon]|nr:hypothetical protein [Candidatus Aenigmarchaeota archaeon]